MRTLLLFFCLWAWSLHAQEPTQGTHQHIQVTATKTPEQEVSVPVSMSIISSQEIQNLGADTLEKALSMTSGVSIAPGGDSGPSGSVPEFWGLKEFDAFLLVVDGVPWGGAFNPSLSSLSLDNVERIEIMKGPAPVMYGATSFVGVIQVIHKKPQGNKHQVSAHTSSYGSFGANLNYQLPRFGDFSQSLTISYAEKGFKDSRTSSNRSHIMYRLGGTIGQGHLHMDTDINFLAQNPASPFPREGTQLSNRIELDTNVNPEGARLDQNHFHIGLGYDVPLGAGAFHSSLSFSRTDNDNLRGFLRTLDETEYNATGYNQNVVINNTFVDLNWAFQKNDIHWLFGADLLAGKGSQSSENFLYSTVLNPTTGPSLSTRTVYEETEMDNERVFGGIYSKAEWTPTSRLRFDIGARLNLTQEKQDGAAREPNMQEEEEGGSNSKSLSRLSSNLGMSYALFHHENRELRVFGNYRNTFKPAAIDFGPEAEGSILAPETANCMEMGLKWWGESTHLLVSLFSEDFSNLVVSQEVNGLPQLVNAGEERFQGAELEGRINITTSLQWQASYSYHDAKFRDYTRLFDGVPFQLKGNRLELSANHLAAMAFNYFPDHGLGFHLQANYTGSRFMDMRNRAQAEAYATFSASLSFKHKTWLIRLNGENLTDRRDPIAESELGDAQYYLLPARRFQLSVTTRF